jgi:DNA-directed RNA polymerase specialized sigma subunit
VKLNLNIASIWAALVTTGTAMLWLFQNIAWADDITRIEVQLLKQEIREIRRELRDRPQDDEVSEWLEKDLEELIDALCTIEPEDRECQ